MPGIPRNRLCRAAGIAPLEGAEVRGSKPACAGWDGTEEPLPLAATRGAAGASGGVSSLLEHLGIHLGAALGAIARTAHGALVDHRIDPRCEFGRQPDLLGLQVFAQVVEAGR